jgi:archaeal type IV pilus assembly protein PilA
MKNFNRNLKAISPIFATLILIAIAVIAGVVVYMFTSGTLATMTGGGTAAQEKVSVQAVSTNSTGFTAYAQSTSGSVVKITNAIIKDSSGVVLSTVAVGGTPVSLTSGQLVSVTGLYTFTSGSSYTVTLVSQAGGNFVSSSFRAA